MHLICIIVYNAYDNFLVYNDLENNNFKVLKANNQSFKLNSSSRLFYNSGYVSSLCYKSILKHSNFFNKPQSVGIIRKEYTRSFICYIRTLLHSVTDNYLIISKIFSTY